MESDPMPLQVVILEDDALACLSLQQLLGRDLRTEVMAVFSLPGALLDWIKSRSEWELPHVFVIDAEYTRQPNLAELLAGLQAYAENRPTLLMSQHGGEELIRLAARLELAGLVLKREIGLAVATAVYLAYTSGPVYSSALEMKMEAMAIEPEVRRLWHKGRRLARWCLLNKLSPRQEEVAWHCLVFGMSAQLAGEEIKLAQRSVEKYRTYLYDKIEKHAQRLLDLDPLKPVMHRLYRSRPDNYEKANRYDSFYTGDEWAFHILTQLPRRDEALRNVDRLRNWDTVNE